MTRKIAFHQNGHGIKAKGDMDTSSLPAIISLKKDPDEMKNGGHHIQH